MDNISVIIVKFSWENETEFIKSEPDIIKNLNGVSINRSYFWMNEENKELCSKILGYTPDLPCWVAQDLISEYIFGDNGITFLRRCEQYYNGFFLWATEFSNVHTTFKYTEQPIIIDDYTYSSVEHFFQISKSVNHADFPRIRNELNTLSDHEIFNAGRSLDLRSDWEDIKLDIMKIGLSCKFNTSTELSQLLLSTGDNLLVQLKPNDESWGTGRNGRGLNMQGALLMEIRNNMRKI